jgi:FdhD protein
MRAREVAIVRYRGRETQEVSDRVVEEEPLEIQVSGVPVAVVMRTPGHDEELVTGFLVTEGVVSSFDDVRGLKHCDTVPDPEAEDNVMQVTLADGVDLDIERLRRNLYASSSCGVCGKATIDNALQMGPPVEDPMHVAAHVLYGLPEKLRMGQEVFERTGGLHAAGLFDAAGELLCIREDVGRHNAVDKVIGWATHQGLSLSGHVLMVSGRIGFEIVQKSVAAKLPVLAGISAPSSLAVRLGEALGVTVVGFVRGESMNVYARAERVVA